MNSIEEKDNLIALLQEALKFYADKNNYVPTNTKNSLDDRYLTHIEVDEGFQARFAIEKVNELAKINQKLQDDYDEIVMDSESIESSDGETNPIDLINKIYSSKHIKITINQYKNKNK